MGTSIIGLTGGEPMTRDDIFDIVGAIDERSTSTLFTSGCNLSLEKAKELKRRKLFSIGISLDSYDKEKHNKNRKGKLPLSKEESIDICSRCKSNKFPKYYRDLQ